MSGDLDATRLDLERREWAEAVADSERRVRRAWEQGAAYYPTLGPAREPARGTIYGSRRSPTADADEETRTMDQNQDQGRWVPAEESVTYAEARNHALHHAVQASRWAGATSESGRLTAMTQAATSRAWSALAGLLRSEEARDYAADLTRQLREQGLTPTGRRVRVPQAQEMPMSTSLGPVFPEPKRGPEEDAA